MYKVINSSENITPLAGLNFIFAAISDKKIANFIDQQLGYRNFRAKYMYSDLIFSLLGNALTNGEFVADLQYLKDNYQEQIFQKIPSHDTIEYASQELKTEDEIIISENSIRHQINRNDKLNHSLSAICKYLNLLESAKKYTLDFDNVVLETEKQDSKKSYKMTNAYHPAFANIGNLTVFFEGRNGNTPAKYGQKKALETCFKDLNDSQISIESFRGDSASYQQDVIELLATKVDYFYIRNITSQRFRRACTKAENWVEIVLNYEKKEVSSIKYKPFNGEKEYRIVVTRTKTKKEQLELFEEDKYTYYGIITNNLIQSEQEIIEFYNQRGNDSENNNKNFLNDFNVSRLPFMDMNTNGVYMGMMLICSNLFEWIKKVLVQNKVPGIEQCHRVKRVFFRYIMVCGKWVRHAKQSVLKLFSNKKYAFLTI